MLKMQAEVIGKAKANVFYEFSLGTLAVWRIAHLLQAEDGPGMWSSTCVAELGQDSRGSSSIAFYLSECMDAAPFAVHLGETWSRRIILWLALSAGAILLERATDRKHGEAPALYIEESEDEYVLRRTSGQRQLRRPGEHPAPKPEEKITARPQPESDSLVYFQYLGRRD